MMYSRVNYTVVGIFISIFGIGLFVFGFWLSKYGLKDSFSTYRVEMRESVAGLSQDATVKYRGVNIGRVDSIEISQDDIEVIVLFLEIRKSVIIKEDMVAQTKMLGVTGLLAVEIDGGSNSSKTLNPTDTYIPTINSKISLIHKLTDSFDNINKKVDTILSKVETILEKAEDSLFKFDKTMVTLERTLVSAEANFIELKDDFHSIKDVTVPMIDKLIQTSKNFNRVTLKVEKSLDRGDYNVKKILEPILIDTRILSNRLTELSKKIESNPSDFLFKSRQQRRGPGE